MGRYPPPPVPVPCLASPRGWRVPPEAALSAGICPKYIRKNKTVTSCADRYRKVAIVPPKLHLRVRERLLLDTESQ